MRDSGGKRGKLRTLAEPCVEKAEDSQRIAEGGKRSTAVGTVKGSLTSSDFNKLVNIGCYE